MTGYKFHDELRKVKKTDDGKVTST